jgi:hypothetical protein
MGTFQAKTFLKHDDYMTPKTAWEDIQNFLPKDKIIWEAFYGDGESGKYLKEMGYNVIHEPVDFFENDLGDVVVTNPPFSKSAEVLTRLKQLGKPFIILLPSSKVNTQYFRNLFGKCQDPIQLIIPKKRIHFIKKVDGLTPDGWRNSCNFDCFYYCWKMNLERDLTWIK